MEPPPLQEADVPQRFIGPIYDEARVWPNTDWWNNFNDAELSAFIEEVKASNLDLANNRRNLESAQLTLREAGLARWPEPELTIGDATSYSRTSLNGATVSRGNESDATQLAARFSYTGIVTKPATYARDLTDYDSEVARAADVAINTLGTATSTFFQLLLIRDRIVAARQNLENAEVIGRIAQARVDAGVSVPIDALQQHYGFLPEALVWWQTHQVADVRHSSIALEVYSRFVRNDSEKEICLRAAERMLAAWRVFDAGIIEAGEEARTGRDVGFSLASLRT